ncbi:hypothetical protein OUZ56_005829 [Daphnia magna]|uniref:Uncharacterized protein n=1 Tax=Daphnia magna TaxID=35525 RepID=A0ABQ9YTW3_9CRUS|nr:hypothetical protein OUZ56_005829 [Daphnia magna]
MWLIDGVRLLAHRLFSEGREKSRQRLRSGVSHVGRLVSVRHEKKKITAYPPKSSPSSSHRRLRFIVSSSSSFHRLNAVFVSSSQRPLRLFVSFSTSSGKWLL